MASRLIWAKFKGEEAFLFGALVSQRAAGVTRGAVVRPPSPPEDSLHGRGVAACPLDAMGEEELRTLARLLLETIVEVEYDRRLAAAKAVRDPLTELFNRRAFDGAVRRRGPVLLADLSSLKAWNDGPGQEAGDTVLRRAASKLRSIAATEGVSERSCFRVGGDEFAVLAGGPTPGQTLERICQSLNAPHCVVARTVVDAAPLVTRFVAVVGHSYADAGHRLARAKHVRKGQQHFEFAKGPGA